VPTPDRRSPAPERSLDTTGPVSLPPDPHRLPNPNEWFAPDAERHLLDRPRFCPMCGLGIAEGFGITTEYWTADARNFMTWCGECGWFGEVVRFTRVTITEEEH
jgi:hypothetical protein